MTTGLSAQSESTRHALAEAANRYHGEGWMLGTSGNLSARIPGGSGIVITASGCDKGRLTPADFVEVTEAGELVGAGEGRRASAETSIHTAVYRTTPSAQAVLHVHTVATTLVASANEPKDDNAVEILRFKGLEMLKGWGFWDEGVEASLPTFRNHAHVPDIAAQLAHWLSTPLTNTSIKAPAMLIASHGVTAWGASLEEAHRHLEVTEFLCRLTQG